VRCDIKNWSQSIETVLRAEYKMVRFISINAGRHPRIPWLVSSIIERFCKVLLRFGVRNARVVSLSISKRSYLISSKLGKMGGNYDIVIGHNLGSLFPLYRYCHKNGIKGAFDLEDLHYGEIENSFFRDSILSLFKVTFPSLQYISFASPLYQHALRSEKLLENISCVDILNCFKSEEFAVPDTKMTDRIKLFWFSQNINEGRGLESIIDLMDQFSTEYELHLLGNLDPEFGANYISGKLNVFVHNSLPQSELHKIVGKFDVGLALEDSSRDENKDLCISNKLFAYYQAGLFILASSTSGHKLFIEKVPESGLIVSAGQLKATLKELLRRKSEIQMGKQVRKENATRFSWEKEKRKLSTIWRELLNFQN